jgi:hypothetical protein
MSEFDDTLLALTTAGATAPLPAALNPFAPVQPSGKSTLFTNVEDAAIDAETAGQKVVRLNSGKAKPKDIKETSIDTQIKSNPNISSTADYTALNDLQQRLANAVGDEKIDLAFQLKTMAQSQARDDYGKFVKQAETRFGIPDIEANIRTLTEMENVDPNRPPGVMSDQRKVALNMLGTARIQSRQYTEELMKGNTSIQKAILHAESVLASFKLDDDKIRLGDARAEQAYRAAQKIDFLSNPKMLNRIITMQTGNPQASQEMREATATRLAIKADPKLLELANLDKNSIYELLLDPKYKDVDKGKLKNMLIADEVGITGSVERAQARMKLIDTVISDSFKLDSDKLEGLGIPIPKNAEADVLSVTKRYKDSVKEVTEGQNIRKSDAEKNQTIGTLSAIAKREILKILTLNDFKENVNSWQGLIQSDPTASALIAKADKSRPYNMDAFIADYLNTKDDKTLPQKAEMLRQIVSSGVGANNKGSLLPELNPESIVMAIDKLAAATIASITFANIRASDWGSFQDQYRNITTNINNR